MSELKSLLLREKIIKLIRSFFYNRGFHEIITPVLNEAIPLEQNIYPFETIWHTNQGEKRFYLSTSPEKNLKNILALGVEKCFSIGHSFRNLETAGPLHSPEFLMLEWYRKNADYLKIMKDTENLIIYLIKKLKISHLQCPKKIEKISLVYLFQKYCLLDLKKIISDEKILFDYAKKKGYQTKNASWNELYDQIFVSEIESHLPKSPCFLIDFPSKISPLCKPKKDQPYLAERFELYINGIEIANGNTENTDTQSILKLFKSIQKYYQSKKFFYSSPPIDYQFIDSLKKMKNAEYAGIGLGVDRLVKLFYR